MHITLYKTPTCPYCKLTRDLLKELNVEWHEVDVSMDHAKAKEMIDKSGSMGVPVLEINGRIIVGFNPDLIKEAVAASRK